MTFKKQVYNTIMKNTITKKPKGWRNIVVNGTLYYWTIKRTQVFALNTETKKKFLLTYMWKDWNNSDIERAYYKKYLRITPKMVAESINQDDPLT